MQKHTCGEVVGFIQTFRSLSDSTKLKELSTLVHILQGCHKVNSDSDLSGKRCISFGAEFPVKNNKLAAAA